MDLQPINFLNGQPGFRKTVAPLVVIGLLMIFEITLSLSRFFQLHAAPLSTAMTVDLVFVIPFIYFVLSPRTRHSKLVTTLLFTLGIIIAGFIIPQEQQFFLTKIKYWVIPVVEIITVTLLVVKVKAYRRESAQHKTADQDFFTMFKSAASQIVPEKIAILLATELSVIYFAFFCWKKPEFNPFTFSYHKKSGSIAVLSVFVFMILVECTALHLLLTKWNPKVAWGVSVLSLYAALQVFGMTRSMFKRPIQITGDTLILRYGLFSSTTIPIATIAEIEISTKDMDLNEEVKKLSPLKSFEGHNTIIRLKTYNSIEGIYGTAKPYKILLLHVDEQLSFKEEIDKLIFKSRLS